MNCARRSRALGRTMAPRLIESLTSSKTLYTRSWASRGEVAPVDDELVAFVHQILLAMFDEVRKACDKHGLQLFLVGGSSLGAIRHEGFIPWDDDLDLGMRRCEYVRFVEMFNGELGNKFVLNAPNYSKNPIARFPKILPKESYLREIGGEYAVALQDVVFLDLFTFENVPDNVLHRTVKGIKCTALEFIAGQVQFAHSDAQSRDEERRLLGGVAYSIKMFVGRVFSFRNASIWLNRVDRAVQYKDESSKRVSIPTGRKHYFGETLFREAFSPDLLFAFAVEIV